MPHIFDEADARLTEQRIRLREVLSDSEWESAKRTTLNAHYTAPGITSAVWDALGEAGFSQGRVLEPGSGAGTFIGSAPEGAQMVGVELDETTARISAALYPQAQIHAQGFEDTRFPEDSFEAVVGNVPFGSFSVHDRRHNPNGHSIHNHFIIKSLRHTAPGGYVAVISSAYTLGSRGSKARDEMSRYGDLVGAVRLPQGTHSATAGTDVSTDVLVFRRRDPDRPMDLERVRRWVEAGTTTVGVDGESVEVDWPGYFEDHPDHVIGSVVGRTDPYGNLQATVVREGLSVDDITAQLQERLSSIISETELAYEPKAPAGTAADHSPGLHTAQTAEARVGHVRMVTESGKKRLERYGPDYTWQPVKPQGVRMAEASALLELRDLARATVAAQAEGRSEDAVALRQRLTTAYQRYYQTHYTEQKREERLYGVNRRVDKYRQPSQSQQAEQVREAIAQWRQDNNVDDTLEPPTEVREQVAEEAAAEIYVGTEQRHLKFLQGDPDLGLLLSIEHYDPDTGTAVPAAIQQRDIVGRSARTATAATVQDAVAVSMEESRRVDPARVSQLLDVDEATALEQLRGHAFTDPATGVMTSAPQYLAGNVRRKLEAARAAAAEDRETYGDNVAALEEVVPAEIDLADVRVAPGARWVPERLHVQFARELFEVQDLEVYRNRSASGESIAGQDKWHVRSPAGGYPDHVRFDYGLPKYRRTPHQILELAMNNSPVRFTRENEDRKRVVDEAATQAGRERVEKIRTRFAQWVVSDPGRKAELQDRYNELFNSVVPADYTAAGHSLTLPGLAADREPYSYQRSAVARAISEPSTLLDHVVGAGKTGTMVMTAMEMRRTGQANKPALVVPNHLVDQIATEFRQWYPTANVMAIPTGLTKPQKATWIAQAAGGDWDCVVVGQTTFEAIPIDPARRQQWLEQEIREAEDYARGVAEDKGGGSAHVKQAQQAAQRLRKQFREDEGRTFDGLSFEQTGIDFLLVDEAHHYKNLARQAELAELSHSGSKRARDLDQKLRTLREFKLSDAEQAGIDTEDYVPSVAVFATGTPVANSMSELWVMQRYLRPDLLEDTGLSTVDAWATQFTELETKMQLSVTGQGYEPRTKVGRYINTPELAEMNRVFTDRVTPGDLEVPIPVVAGGERRLLVREPTEQVARYTDDMLDRVEAIRRGIDPRVDNMLKLSSDARKVALDPRMVGLDADVDGGKLFDVADQIERIYTATAQSQYRSSTGEPSSVPGGLQIVFCDQGTPGSTDLDVYQALKDELAGRGIPTEKVAFIHDAETDAARGDLFRACREGQVSVLIGSTQKMGTGANIQTRAVALHHLDVPWRPADLEQREGRILRQGNQNSEVELLAYGTEKTFDVRSWDIVAHKAKFISQWKSGMVTDREMADPIPGLEFSASEAAAVLTGDPRIQQREDLQLKIRELKTLEEAHQQNRAQMRREQAMLEHQIDYQATTLPQLQALAAQVRPTEGEGFSMTTAQGTRLTERADAGEHLVGLIKAEAFRRDAGDFLDGTDPQPAGRLGGVDLVVRRQASKVQIGTGVTGVYTQVGVSEVHAGKVTARGIISRAENLVAGLEERAHRMETELGDARDRVGAFSGAGDTQFERGAELASAEAEFIRLDAEINGIDLEEGNTADTSPVTGDALRRIHDVEGKLRIREVGGLREGDLVKDGPEFSKVAVVADDEEPTGVRRYLYDPDEHESRPSDEELSDVDNGFRPVFGWDDTELVSREYEQLTDWERAMEAFDPSEEVIERHPFRVNRWPAGTRLTLRGVDDSAPVTGYISDTASTRGGWEGLAVDAEGEPLTVREDYLPGPIIVHDVGEQIGERERAAAARAAEVEKLRTVDDFLPGEVLEDEVPEFGQAGDVVALTGPRQARVAIDPATGEQRQGRPWMAKAAEYKSSEAKMLSAAQRQKLYGTTEAIATQVGDLRPGDVVEAHQVHTKGPRGQRVQVTRVMSNGASDSAQSSIRYRGLDGSHGDTGTKRNGSAVEVHERLEGALNPLERAALVWADHEQRPLRELNDADCGTYVVALSPTSGPVLGKLTEVEQINETTTRIEVAVGEGQREHLTSQEATVLTVNPEQPLDVAELYRPSPALKAAAAPQGETADAVDEPRLTDPAPDVVEQYQQMQPTMGAPRAGGPDLG
ncbi:DEAD/DEAH box helicase family protein [Nesterenkonia marinintestina]|uniref:DEAD/DEAH box helicase family protein n=1 Tax=Nesterenkonia marinintestina TaxID=2979865 RepID=UPI0021C16EE8|nr:DEAD/DEAH box helicase family protein [Nesterenkonia sp. GX14115]